jgi:GDSL-like lipase/acylhydrolase family protein
MTRKLIRLAAAWPLLAIAVAAPAAARADGTVVAATHAGIRYQGHWDLSGSRATTVNSGSRITLRFTGRRLVGRFDVSSITNPPQIYVSIDRRAPALLWVDRPAITLASGLRKGAHRADIAVKDVDERANRWVPPLQSGLIITGYELDAGAALRPVPRGSGPRMEFLGDSITQGVRAVGPQIGPRGADATKDYAWLTGTAFGADFHQVGFGAQGILRPGGGQVPPAPAAFGLNFAGSPAPDTPAPRAVVVNQGTNDALNGVPSAQFQPAYEAYLRRLRSAWPNAWIFALRPFGGYFATEIAKSVSDLGDRRIVYVDTTGWLSPPDFMDGLHPTYAGHTVVTHRLTRVTAARTGWRARVIRPATTALLTGFESAGARSWEPGQHLLSAPSARQPRPTARRPTTDRDRWPSPPRSRR